MGLRERTEHGTEGAGTDREHRPDRIQKKKTQETGTADSFHLMNRAVPSPAIAFRKRYSVLPEHSNGLVRSE